MNSNDLVTALASPPKRTAKADGEHEHHVDEGAMMPAYVMHLLRTEGAQDVCMLGRQRIRSRNTENRFRPQRDLRLAAQAVLALALLLIALMPMMVGL